MQSFVSEQIYRLPNHEKQTGDHVLASFETGKTKYFLKFFLFLESHAKFKLIVILFRSKSMTLLS